MVASRMRIDRRIPLWIGLSALASALASGCSSSSSSPTATTAATTTIAHGGAGGAHAGGSGGSGGAHAGGASSTGGAGGAHGAWDARFDPFVKALLDDLAASKAFGVSAAILEHGQVTFAHAFGSKDADGKVPLAPDTLMQIGSTTKQLAATAVLRKVEQGKVKLDATLKEMLPDLDFSRDATWSSAILLRHLISHTAGSYDMTPWGGSSADSELAKFTYGTFAKQEWMMSPSGAFWNYANPNFILAGLVAERLDGRAYPDLMREDIFVPLGMKRTFLRKAEVEADGDYALSYGYTAADLAGSNPTLGPVTMAEMSDSAWVRPAGLTWTTPTQMMSWASFVMHGNPAVLSDELRQEITKEQVDTLYLSGNQHYGYGMFVMRGYLTAGHSFYPTPVWEHGGNTLSFTNILTILPEKDFAIAICSSAYATDFQGALDAAVTTLVDLPAPTAGPKYVIDPSTFDRHVGTYEDPYNVGEVVITRQGDDLYVSAPTAEKAGYTVEPKLKAVSSEIFLMTLAGQTLDLTFIPATPGGPSMYIRNRAFVTTRVPDAPDGGAGDGGAPAAKAEVPIEETRARIARALIEAKMQPLRRF
jgi:CubicO group peptidase (beta-lactamase class C family)